MKPEGKNRGYQQPRIWIDAIDLYIASGSLRKSISGFFAYNKAGQFTEVKLDKPHSLSFKIDNGLIKLISTLKI